MGSRVLEITEFLKGTNTTFLKIIAFKSLSYEAGIIQILEKLTSIQ